MGYYVQNTYAIFSLDTMEDKNIFSNLIIRT